MGALVARKMATLGSNTDTATPATSSWTPTNGRVAFTAMAVRRAAGESADPTAAGNGLTWTHRATTFQDPIKLSVFSAPVASSSAGAVTVTYADTQDACAGMVVEVDNGLTTGPGLQYTEVLSAGAVTTLAVSLGAGFGSEWNGHLVFYAVDTNQILSASAAEANDGWATLGSATASDGITIGCCWRADNEASITLAWSSAEGQAIAIELVHEGVTGGNVGSLFDSPLIG